ncbi:MAG: efflux RND transporter periplasmic adaptor subunit [Planctomycetia bacterium]|nr:efflux RND transporter periplasmic adaptor subunit [Planctomycetia bacterium]
MRSVSCLGAFLCLVILAGCTKPQAGRADAPPAPVLVATAGKKTVPIRIRTIGTVKTISTVAIRPRVGGELTGVFFKEGDFVKQNQKLFTIDPRPYEAAVKQAEANMAKNVAILAGAELDLKRVEQAKSSGVGSAIEYDAALTAVASAKAAIVADKAAINTAKLQASFTTIVSPIDGRVGELLVNRGNLVEPNGLTPLVVINQVSPITVTFTLPEQQLPVVIEARKKGPLKVEADLRGGGPLAVGELTFIDNVADTQTGTVQFKASFANEDQKLWPGLFVDVVLTLGARPESVVVPSATLQSGQKGQYVYVVTPDKKAEMRPVAVAFEDEGEAVIASGLKSGETVVVEGQLRLAPGAKVEPKPYQGPPRTPGVPPVPQVVTGGPQ